MRDSCQEFQRIQPCTESLRAHGRPGRARAQFYIGRSGSSGWVRCVAGLRYKCAAMSQGPLRRPDLVAEQQLRPPFGHRRFTAADPPVRAGITGSGPALLLLAWSAADLVREIEAGARVLGRLCIGPGTRVANTLPGALATPRSEARRVRKGARARRSPSNGRAR